MASFARGRVSEVLEASDDLVRALVETEGGVVTAVGYPAMLGALEPGHEVVLNTSGLEMELGTGGVAFLVWNLDGDLPPRDLDGHIVKLRYTPWQVNVMAAETPESPHHEALAHAVDLRGTPVVACSLHSQVPGIAAGIRAARPDARIGYLMTDGGALPMAFSNLVRQMRDARLIDVTCTAGHAFGGDLESVNVFSGMLALALVGNCDVVVAGMGPGVVGTASALGHTALEQGQLLDAATALGGRAIAALRISFGEERGRHAGLSHHTVSALTIAARERSTVAVPKLKPDRARLIERALKDTGICDRHDTRIADGRPGVALLQERGLDPTSMGRAMSSEPDLWLAAAAAGAVATETPKPRG